MNIKDVKQLKTQYEQMIKDSIVQMLQIQQQDITVEWELERTTVMLSLYDKNSIVNFVFQYTENDFVITTSSYKPVMQNNMVVGIIASDATINLATIEAIRNAISDVLSHGINEDNCEGEPDAE
jgi:hypothetical protein